MRWYGDLKKWPDQCGEQHKIDDDDENISTQNAHTSTINNQIYFVVIQNN